MQDIFINSRSILVIRTPLQFKINTNATFDLTETINTIICTSSIGISLSYNSTPQHTILRFN